MKTGYPRDIGIPMFIAAVFTIVKIILVDHGLYCRFMDNG